jgi:molecular chaperone GrpE
MAELSTARVPGKDSVPAQAKLTVPEIDALLAGFRDWLVQVVSASESLDRGIDFPPAGAEPEGPDLHEFLGQLIALRHEVNLQTRATRTQQEQNAETLNRLAEAVQLLEKNQEDEEEPDAEAPSEALRPLLKALLDVHDALSLARREIERVQSKLEQSLRQCTLPAPQSVAISLPAWARWLGLDTCVMRAQEDAAQTRAAGSRQLSENLDSVRCLVDSIVTGYGMSLQRLERSLQQHGLEPIQCVGETFDPESMEVVEVVPEFGRTGSEVIEEVRRGYLWQGRVFRFAQVKVARPGDGKQFT